MGIVTHWCRMLGHISEHVDQVGNIDGSIYVVTGLCSHDNFERERNKMSNMINVVCSRLAQTGYSCFRFARPMFAHTKQSSLFVSLFIISHCIVSVNFAHVKRVSRSWTLLKTTVNSSFLEIAAREWPCSGLHFARSTCQAIVFFSFSLGRCW